MAFGGVEEVRSLEREVRGEGLGVGGNLGVRVLRAGGILMI